jgi:hypothetical protein
MMFLLKIARQPIFQFLAIIIVLILTDIRTSFGIVAAIFLLIWIAIARSPIPDALLLVQKFRNM